MVDTLHRSVIDHYTSTTFTTEALIAFPLPDLSEVPVGKYLVFYVVYLDYISMLLLISSSLVISRHLSSTVVCRRVQSYIRLLCLFAVRHILC